MRPVFFKLVLLLASFLIAAASWSQAKKISGRITSGEDGKPLTGVNVIIQGKPGGTQTDNNGDFSIEAAPGDVLLFSYTGFTKEEMIVGSSSVLNLSLKTSAAKLDEVVVVGYGTSRRSKMTSSVA